MKKQFSVLVFLCIYIASYCFELSPDILDIDKNTFVKDQTNKLQQGNVIRDGEFIYYKDRINYSIVAERTNPDSLYIYYSSSNEDKSYLVSLLDDIIRYYGKKAICSRYRVLFGKGEDIEPQLIFTFSDGRSIILYSKIKATEGIYGIGVTYKDSEPSDFISPNGLIAMQAYENFGRSAEIDDTIWTNLRTDIVYINSKYTIDMVEYQNGLTTKYQVGEYAIYSIIKHYLDYKNEYWFKIKIKLLDPSIIEDPWFISQHLCLSDGSSITFNDILEKKDGYLVFSKNKFMVCSLNMVRIIDDNTKYDINAYNNKFVVSIIPCELK